MVTFLHSSVESCEGGVCHHLLDERVCPYSSKNETVIAIVTFILSSEVACGGGLGIAKEKEVCPSSPTNGRSMTMAIFLPSSVESCGRGHGIFSREEEVCLSTPNKERSMTMTIFILFPHRALCRWLRQIF